MNEPIYHRWIYIYFSFLFPLSSNYSSFLLLGWSALPNPKTTKSFEKHIQSHVLILCTPIQMNVLKFHEKAVSQLLYLHPLALMADVRLLHVKSPK